MDLTRQTVYSDTCQGGIGLKTYAAKTASEAVERVLKFDRNWASFDFPQYLMALNRIQQALFSASKLRAAAIPSLRNRWRASSVRRSVRPWMNTASPAVSPKSAPFLSHATDLDSALQALTRQDLSRLSLHPYEVELLTAARDSLQCIA